MGSREHLRTADIRAKINHPIIDADGHAMYFQPGLMDYLKKVGGSRIVERYESMQVGDWRKPASEATRSAIRNGGRKSSAWAQRS